MKTKRFTLVCYETSTWKKKLCLASLCAWAVWKWSGLVCKSERLSAFGEVA